MDPERVMREIEERIRLRAERTALRERRKSERESARRVTAADREQLRAERREAADALREAKRLKAEAILELERDVREHPAERLRRNVQQRLHVSATNARLHGYVPCAASVDEVLRSYVGVCEVCKRLEEEVGTLHLDHNHATGAFRGWLCRTCNIGIGMLQDDVQLLSRAIDYLNR